MDGGAVILAVASPPGRSLRGIVRIAGLRTFELLAPHWSLGERPARGVEPARLALDGLDLPCAAAVFPGPASYTGEDSAELQLPGNPDLLERVVDALVESGRARGLDARRAEGGEFTARAFLNGRMTLTQAEGVAATIAARSDAELRAAALLTAGRLGALARRLADDLAAALALVEAGIDFTDQEDVVGIAPADLHDRLSRLRGRLAEALARAVGSEQLEAIPWVVLGGRPNAGKSTLFNALLGRSRAVVSDAAGTTRDVLTEPLAVAGPQGGAEVMLVDLAGREAGRDPLGRDVQSAAAAAHRRAELVLHCVGPGEPAPRETAETVAIRTKCDLAPPGDNSGGIAVSAVTGAGLDAVRRVIQRRLARRAVSLAADALALRPRHEAAMRSAARNLSAALELAASCRGAASLAQPELVAAAMRAALDDLGRLAGDVTPDDVLGRIFSTFCVGK